MRLYVAQSLNLTAHDELIMPVDMVKAVYEAGYNNPSRCLVILWEGASQNA